MMRRVRLEKMVTASARCTAERARTSQRSTLVRRLRTFTDAGLSPTGSSCSVTATEVSYCSLKR